MNADLHAQRALPTSSVIMAGAFLVAACGGGGDSDPQALPPAAQESVAAVDASEPRHDAQVKHSGPNEAASAATTTSWVKVADEGQWFTVDKPVLIRFGAGSAWVYKVIGSGGVCSHGLFEQDQADAVHETCEKKVSGSAPP
jgi:hypothetical protein